MIDLSLLREISQFGLGAFIAFVVLWVKWSDDKKNLAEKKEAADVRIADAKEYQASLKEAIVFNQIMAERAVVAIEKQNIISQTLLEQSTIGKRLEANEKAVVALAGKVRRQP